ncbi:Mobile element protein [Collimonas arenae]|uniref:Mobile element protein n=1 Tax=Collimonas arenae TaxID=279058 RepID=A0A0A1FDS8_9BURK|nr:Mobile element protein [Collimonas arenae]
MEEALYETTILRQFSGLSLEHIPGETIILNFRRLPERYELSAGSVLIDGPLTKLAKAEVSQNYRATSGFP